MKDLYGIFDNVIKNSKKDIDKIHHALGTYEGIGDGIKIRLLLEVVKMTNDKVYMKICLKVKLILYNIDA